jgi:DNA (cytosine-5)-methyltransferase 1
MTHGSLFSGIGGFDLAAEWMGWENKFHCEWNPFGQRVLKYYWPDAETFHDITKTDFTKYANKIDILTGGFPCQPYSTAGKRLGKEDERHLWPEMLRAIREIAPRYVVGENVRGLLSWNEGMVFDEVQADLEACGYEVLPFILPACAVNAPHRRDRVWFIAHRKDIRRYQTKEIECGWKEYITHDREAVRGTPYQFSGCRIASDTGDEQLQGGIISRGVRGEGAVEGQGRQFSRPVCSQWEQFPTQSPICTGDDGIPAGLDGITFSKWRNESIKAAGNAIVPQVALQIFKAIEQYEKN